jgi:putative hydrolase of the HAD superfamily
MHRRALMVDVDGVLIKHPHPKGWSANLEIDLGISPPVLQERFFRREWDDVVHGRAAIRDRLAPALAEIAPALFPDVLIEYWFSNDAHVDDCLLAELQHLRREGFELHLATVQEHERARYIWDILGLRETFNSIHYSAALGYSKPNHAFYRAVESASRLSPDAIFFIDDKVENVAAAKECGWTAALWAGDKTLRELMRILKWKGN